MLPSNCAQGHPRHKVPTIHTTVTTRFLDFLLLQSCRLDTTFKTRHLNSHAITHETFVEYHPIVVQCHHGNYHQNYYTSQKLSSLSKNFTLPKNWFLTRPYYFQNGT
ncbi:hypothetical protein QL285_014605 [Trifolium repens]|nr:hypothetical protein QL285_014605 [Trifolium repens]